MSETHDVTAAEQEARDLLEVMEIDNAQNFSAGELVELTNLIVDRYKWRLLAVRQDERIRELEEKNAELRRECKEWKEMAIASQEGGGE